MAAAATARRPLICRATTWHSNWEGTRVDPACTGVPDVWYGAAVHNATAHAAMQAPRARAAAGVQCAASSVQCAARCSCSRISPVTAAVQ